VTRRLMRLQQDRQVAAVDDFGAARSRCSDEATEVPVEFGCAAGEIDCRDAAGVDDRKNEVDGFGVHLLRAVWPGIHMTMQAGLVTGVAEVDLQRVQHPASQRREIGHLQQRQGGAQATTSWEPGWTE